MIIGPNASFTPAQCNEKVEQAREHAARAADLVDDVLTWGDLDYLREDRRRITLADVLEQLRRAEELLYHIVEVY